MYNGIREQGADGKEFIVEPTSNRPLRGGKATVYEGGIREPTVIVWPQVAQPGSRSDQVIQSTDFYPTLLTELGLGMPEDYPVDGMDITPALRGGKLAPRAIFTYFPHSPPVPDWLPPSVSVIAGEWKLIRLFHQGDNGAHDYRLYNLKDDIGETNDVAKLDVERVRELDRLIEDHLAASRAVTPQPNPDFNIAEYHPERIGKQPGGLKLGGEDKREGNAKETTPKLTAIGDEP
jgi:arylsulfatase A-like enzyme